MPDPIPVPAAFAALLQSLAAEAVRDGANVERVVAYRRQIKTLCDRWAADAPPHTVRRAANVLRPSAIALVLAGSIAALVGCDKPADVAARNLAQAADNFEINRRITFMNGMTNQAMLVIEGYCALGNSDSSQRMSVICRTGANEYKRHHLGLGPTVSFISEQIDPAPASTYRYRVTFNPTVVIPDIRMQTP